MDRIKHKFNHSYHAMVRMEERHISSKKLDRCIRQGKTIEDFGKNIYQVCHRNTVAIVNLQKMIVITVWKDSSRKDRRQNISPKCRLDKTNYSRCSRRKFRQNMNSLLDEDDLSVMEI